MTRWTDVLADQSGVIARRQALAAGLAPHDLRRMVRRRELVRLHDGVYLEHHVTRLADRVQWDTSPPRMRLEEAALDVAAMATTDLAAIALLADACQSRRTAAARLLSALEGRPRISRRALLDGALRDVAEGSCSVLEHGYLHLMERPHAFPRARRQARVTASTGVIYRDADYGAVVAELDGRLFHDTASARDADFERDLDAATSGAATLRLSYGQVFDRPCSTAAKVARVLNAHGVVFEPSPCDPGCVVVGSAVA